MGIGISCFVGAYRRPQSCRHSVPFKWRCCLIGVLFVVLPKIESWSLCLVSKSYLVGGFKHFLFSMIHGIILPIDELIFFKIVKTTNQIFSWVQPPSRCFSMQVLKWPKRRWRCRSAQPDAWVVKGGYVNSGWWFGSFFLFFHIYIY